MSKYLNPKADLTFKKVFGEHKDLLVSFLNALLPLPQDKEIVSLEYLPAELVPVNPDKKDTVVDVRCEDNTGRQFLVEMQMYWTDTFMKRALFNTCKAYVRQADRGCDYRKLKAIYTLSLVNDIAFPTMEDEFYHVFVPTNTKNSEHTINDFEMVFVELPKFRPDNIEDKKMMVLWLRFMTEINERTRNVPPELAENGHISKALSIVEEAAYSDAELLSIDKYWDMVSRERTSIGEAEARGLEEGMKEGRAEGRAEEKKSVAISLKQMGVLSNQQIAEATGLAIEEIENL